MNQQGESTEIYDFFISYNSKDKDVAEWISYILEEAGHKVFVQAWDFAAGNNFVLEMQRGASESKHTLALLSENYIESSYTQPEWAAAFVEDPTGEMRKLIPVRISDVPLKGLLPSIVYTDLVGINDEDKAIETILAGVQMGRKKPLSRPSFPGFPSRNDTNNNMPQGEWYNDWITTRLNEIERGSALPKVSEGSKLIVHLIPIEAVTTSNIYSIKDLEQRINLEPFLSRGWNDSINKHGFYTYATTYLGDKGNPPGYVQFFKNGIIESVDTDLLNKRERKYIPGTAFEREILRLIESRYKVALKKLGIKLPFAISITLTDVEDYYISMNSEYPNGKIGDRILKFPTVVVNSWEDDIGKVLRPSFDYLWNNCGVAESPNYDADGNWRPNEGRYGRYQ
ncbi:toll/interleukin-1 receptor domain-containing protein [Bacillus cereus]|uniref:TIR domain-containing protein n=1 Tax=Bacillus thuringiensis TaxID=1428 RepID=A0A9X6KGE3_BACTU|nr:MULTISPECIES: toll/interleukin-1 receptor domain-containing protein [Bacillus cereus group]MDA2615464.1 toll/interleukin-1 receptor domain-containing protein [Bacillus cereus]MEB8824188.1 toll/interleukin-1 receptor domain-containing protein [Bacillus cereus]MEB8976372.1 toll/interleukin-1 receptor domain-containing protein [Bacillus cereus]MEB9136315.1 toll/interleukin-1 receptor domain-containing protein [Bacillus cereus]MEB9513320.1 toll/interleukin-1 receptor domain-containing protein [